MKARELREYSEQELEELLNAERDKLHRMRMVHSISPLENPMQIRYSRKTIARIQTVLSERRSGGVV